MAGSYQHCVDDEGRLFEPSILAQQLENGGDVYEAVEEMYGMIWYLAHEAADSLAEAVGSPEGTFSVSEMVEDARTRYVEGLAKSPGIRGE